MGEGAKNGKQGNGKRGVKAFLINGVLEKTKDI